MGTSIEFDIYDGSAWHQYTATGSPFPSGAAWHQLAVSATRSGSASFYVDGVSAGNANISGTSSTNITNGGGMVIGDDAWCRANYCGQFDGVIDDARVYNRVLSSAEIAALYNAEK